MINETYLYHYRAIVKSAYDADTLRIDIDLGCGIWLRNEPVRLSRIDAPEVRGSEREEGLIARDWVRANIVGSEVLVSTIKDKKGKYGRYVVELVHYCYTDPVNLSDNLVKLGLAEYKEY